LTTFNRRFADQISAHREAFAPPPVENPREGKVSGWQEGGYVVEVGGSRSVRQSATNGSIPVGGVACVRGRVDAQPAISRTPRRPGVRVDVKAGPVKILFSVIKGSEKVFYVGGDRVKPKELFRLPTDTSNKEFSIVNLGRDFYWQIITRSAGSTFVLEDSRFPTSPIVPLALSGGETLRRAEYIGSGIFQYLTVRYVVNAEINTPLQQLDDNTGLFEYKRIADGNLVSSGRWEERGRYETVKTAISGPSITQTETSSFQLSGSYQPVDGIAVIQTGGDTRLRVSVFDNIIGTTVSDASGSSNSRRETPIAVSNSSVVIRSYNFQNTFSGTYSFPPPFSSESNNNVTEYRFEAVSPDGTKILLSPQLEDLYNLSSSRFAPQICSIVSNALYLPAGHVNILRTILLANPTSLEFEVFDLSSAAASTKKQLKVKPLKADSTLEIHSVSIKP
jgi:hypothetical protein